MPLNISFTGKHGEYIAADHTPHVGVHVIHESAMWDEEDLTTFAVAWLKSLGFTVRTEEEMEERRQRAILQAIATQELDLEPDGPIRCTGCGVIITDVEVIDGTTRAMCRDPTHPGPQFHIFRTRRRLEEAE